MAQSAEIMPRAEVKAKFESKPAADYNQKMATLVPFYDEAVALTAEALKVALPAAPRILDLGAGTGKLSKQVLMRVPNSHVTLLDFSPVMLEGTDAMLHGFRGRYTVQIGDVFQVVFPD